MIDVYYTYNKDTLEVNQIGVSTTKHSKIPEYPRDALLVEPLEPKEGFVVRVCDFDSGRPTATEYVADYRDKTIYSKLNCLESKDIKELGDIEEGWTLQKPSTQFDEWIDDAWITNLSNQYIADYDRVDSTRRALYSQMVSPLMEEASMKQLIGTEEALLEVQELQTQALAAREKIQADNPWPTPTE